MGIHTDAHSEFLREHSLEKCEASYVGGKSENHIVGAHHVMQVQSATNDVNGERVRTRDVRALGAAESVACRVPRDDHAMARCRIFFQKLDEFAELIATEMFAPAVAIGHGNNIGRIGEAIPDFGEIAQKICRLARAGDKPNLLSNEHFDWNFAQREKRKSRSLNIVREMHPRHGTHFVAGAAVYLSQTTLHDAPQESLIKRIEFGHGQIILPPMGNITYLYLPAGRTIQYVPEDNEFMREAKKYAQKNSLDDSVQTGSIVVKDGAAIGRGANGSDYHKTHECERVKRGISTGQQYELCEGCHPKNHSEPRAIADAKKAHDTRGADLYLWGHWWACEACWSAIIDAGIAKVYLLEGSERLFNKSDPGNMLGRGA